MKKQELNDVLSNNTYPGRGICLGVDESGEYAVIVYFIMGRSVNSRNRIFAEEKDGIRTQAFAPEKLTPKLSRISPISKPTLRGTRVMQNSPARARMKPDRLPSAVMTVPGTQLRDRASGPPSGR